jgi:hypothetical protein
LRSRFLKCQATVITGFQYPFRVTFSPYLPTLPVTTIFSGCPFDVTVCFCLAASTRFYIFPDEVLLALFFLTLVNSKMSQITPKNNFQPIITWSLAISCNYCFKLNHNFQHLCCIVHERILESICARYFFLESFFVWD